MKDEPGDRDSASLEERGPRRSTAKSSTPARVLVAHSSCPGCCSGLILSDIGFSPYKVPAQRSPVPTVAAIVTGADT